MKRKMKSVLAIVMTFVMMLSIAQICVSAEETNDMVITATEKTAFPGSTVEVDITLKNNPGVASIGLDVSYDKSILSLEKITYNPEMGGTTQSSKITENPATLLWINSSANYTKDATFATLTFKVNERAKENDVSDIKISYSPENIYNLEETNVKCKAVDGKVKVTTVLAGDINNDGFVNNKDVSRLMQYLAHWEVEVNEFALDCNGDKSINNKDVSRLMQYLAHWDVELHPTAEDFGNIDPNPDCEHEIKRVEEVLPSCSKEGHKAYYECSKCGKKFNDFLGKEEISDADVLLEKTEHTLVVDSAVAPTSTTEGKTEGSHCAVCGETIVAQQTIPATENFITYHLYSDDTYLQETGVDNPNPAYYDSNSGLKLKNVKVDGYVFEGWYDGEGANGELVKTIPAGTTGEVELYAKWTPREYTITFNSPLVPVASMKYKVNTGATWTNPSLNGYNFIGWCDKDNKLVTNVSVGTTGNITLYANWTSKRNQTRPVSHLDDPIILEDADKGNIMFAYEIGTIENVPLQSLSQTYQSVGGMKQTYTTSESVTITESEAKNVAKTVSNSTSDSKAWSLSESWNNVTSVSESYAKQKGWTKEEAEQYSKTSSNTYSVNSSSGGSQTNTTSNGISGTLARSNSDTSGGSYTSERENGSEYQVSEKASLGSEISAEAGMEGIGKVGSKISAGYEVGQSEKNYSRNKQSASLNYSNTGTDSASITGNAGSVSSGTSTWNTSSGYSKSSSTSQTNSVRNVLSEVVNESKSYGSSYARGGSKNDTQSFTNTSAESNQYSTAITYSKGTTKTETKSIELGGENEGYYRFVLAGMAHVFAVVGYDVSTSSYYVFTYTVMDDDTYTYIDYSKDTASFNDNENGVLPFEVPYSVKEYVDARIMQSDGLSVSQEGIVTNYSGSDDVVFVPSYYKMDNRDGTYTSIKVKGISSDAFAGKNIKAVSLSNFIEEIPANAFKNCVDLEAVICPGVIRIGDSAFSGCVALREFKIPESVESLGTQAFKGIEKLIVDASTKDVADGAIKSGANQLILNISSNPEEMQGVEFDIPESISRFELRGGAKEFDNIRIISNAETTVLNGLTINSTVGAPVKTSSKNVILNRLNISSAGFATILTNDDTNVELYGSVKMSSENGKTVLCKNICLKEVDAAISSSLSITGDLLICGAIDGEKYLNISDGNIVQISNEEFEKYVKGCYEIAFDADGGTIDTLTKTVYYGSKYGELPLPTKSFYLFNGWYTDATEGDKVTEDTIFDQNKNVTLYAHWTINPTSGWVLENELPENAKVVDEKWTYDLVTRKTSSSSTMSGYTKYDTTWKWGSYGNWSGWQTSKVTGSDSRQVETKNVAAKTHTEYHYYRWINGNYVYTYQYNSSYKLQEKWTTYQLPKSSLNSFTEMRYEGSDTYANRWIMASYSGNNSCSRTFTRTVTDSPAHTEYRYRDRSKVYTYYFQKTEAKESTTEVKESINTNAPSESITNVKKWVKYINK